MYSCIFHAFWFRKFVLFSTNSLEHTSKWAINSLWIKPILSDVQLAHKKARDISAETWYADVFAFLGSTPWALQISHEALEFIHPVHAPYCQKSYTLRSAWTFMDSKCVQIFSFIKSLKCVIPSQVWDSVTYLQKFKAKT